MMRRITRLISALLLLGLLAWGPLGCANSKTESNAGYYRRGSIHTDSYPGNRAGNYGYYRYGRPGGY